MGSISSAVRLQSQQAALALSQCLTPGTSPIRLCRNASGLGRSLAKYSRAAVANFHVQNTDFAVGIEEEGAASAVVSPRRVAVTVYEA